jgi:GNAT superfamily N-acetyltransferase
MGSIALNQIPPYLPQLRQATLDDEVSAFTVMEEAMRCYVEATWGPWDAELQAENHRLSFKPESHQLVIVEHQLAGLVAVEEHSSHHQLEKLYLLSPFRNQGFGAVLLQTVVDQANAVAKPVRLRVLKVNVSAQRFYAKHGFKITDETAERCFMERLV